jgi:hypothetical protein
MSLLLILVQFLAASIQRKYQISLETQLFEPTLLPIDISH